jgi:flagellar basal body-associated protein FliL
VAVIPKTTTQRINALAIAVIFFVLAGIAGAVVSTVSLIRLRNQAVDLKRIAEAGKAQSEQNEKIVQAVLDNQGAIKRAAEDAKRTADYIKDCTVPEGECFKQQQARDEAIVTNVVQGVSTVNRRQITRDVQKVETTTQVQGEATRATVEEKAEQVKDVVIENPSKPVVPGPCALELGGVALLCTIPPKEP